MRRLDLQTIWWCLLSSRTTGANASAELLTISAVATEVLYCSEDTVRRMIARGELPAVRIGKRLIRIRRRDIERAMRPVTRVDLVTSGAA